MIASKVLVAALAAIASAKTVRSPTPPMGWNSYNSFNCKPSEEKVKTTARGLVELGLVSLGYNFATVDCGWNGQKRDSQNRLQWDTTLFPSGGKALGDYLHGLGLDFGLYSGGGYLQCGSTDLPASLGTFLKAIGDLSTDGVQDMKRLMQKPLLNGVATC